MSWTHLQEISVSQSLMEIQQQPIPWLERNTTISESLLPLDCSMSSLNFNLFIIRDDINASNFQCNTKAKLQEVSKTSKTILNIYSKNGKAKLIVHLEHVIYQQPSEVWSSVEGYSG